MRITLTRSPTGDDHPQIAQAVADLRAAGGGHLELYGSGGSRTPFAVKRPVVLDASDVTVSGLGRGATMLRAYCAPAPLMVGFSRQKADVPAACWEPLAGLLDGTQGPRWGFRTRKAAVATFPCSPMDTLDWARVRRFTIDLAFASYEPAPDGWVPLFGGRDRFARPVPFELAARATTGTGTFSLGTAGNCAFAWRPTPGRLHRLAAQVDLDAGQAWLWADGLRVPLATPPLAGRSLPAREDNGSFKLAATGHDSYTWGQHYGRSPNDTLVAGFHATAGLRYQWADALARLDGAPATDARTYFAREPGTVFLLSLSEPAPADRLLRYETYPVAGMAAWSWAGYGAAVKGYLSGGLPDAVGGVQVRNLWLHAGPVGAALLTGVTYDLLAQDCLLTGDAYAAYDMPTAVDYPQTWERVTFSRGRVAGSVATRSTVTYQTCTWSSYAGVAARLVGCNATFRKCLFAQSDEAAGNVLEILEGQAGGLTNIDDGTLFNYERPEGPRGYHVYAEMERVAQSPQTVVSVRSSAFANNGPDRNKPYVALACRGATGNKGSARVSDCSRLGWPAVQVLSGAWSVAVEGAQPDGVPAVIDKDGKPVAEVKPG